MILPILALHIAEACHNYYGESYCIEYQRTLSGKLISKGSWLNNQTTDEDEEDEPVRDI